MCLAEWGISQNPEVDSLLLIYNSTKQDTAKLSALYQVTEVCDENDIIKYSDQVLKFGESLLKKYANTPSEYSVRKNISGALNNIGYANAIHSDFKTAQDYYKKSLEISIAIGDTESIAGRYLNIAGAYMTTGSTDSAVKYYSSAIEIAKAQNDKQGVAWGYSNLGQCYVNMGKYQKALDYYLKGLKINETLNDKRGMANCYNNIAIVYFDQNQVDKAEEYYSKAMQAAKEAGDNHYVGLLLGNLGDIYTKQNKFDKALEILREGVKVNRETGDKALEAHSLFNTAICFLEMSKHDSVLENSYVDSCLAYSLKSLQIHEAIDHREGMAYNYELIGRIYGKRKQYEKEIEYGLKALKLSRDIHYLDIIKRSAQMLADAYAAKKDFKEAYNYHQLYSSVKDTMLNEESSKQITEMQTKYETEKKEQQITLLNKDKELQDAQLNRQKIIIWSVAGGLLVVLILSIFIFRERKKSEKLLLNILPAETARELKQNGKATARHYESVTVMFTDFKGFTSIAEKLSAEELVSELDFIFKKFDEIISKYSIEKIKTIGDAYMCASGLPAANSNHADEIVKAGIEIQSWMTSQNNKWSLRMGIHSGPVTAGVVGDKKFAYDIWGDTVNTASRMESSGEPGRINISGATYVLIKEKFKCEFRGKIPAKNKGEIEMYFVEKRA